MYLIMCLDRVSGMALFVKLVWECELECWGVIFKILVYSNCGVVLMLPTPELCSSTLPSLELYTALTRA